MCLVNERKPSHVHGILRLFAQQHQFVCADLSGSILESVDLDSIIGPVLVTVQLFQPIGLFGNDPQIFRNDLSKQFFASEELKCFFFIKLGDVLSCLNS